MFNPQINRHTITLLKEVVFYKETNKYNLYHCVTKLIDRSLAKENNQ